VAGGSGAFTGTMGDLGTGFPPATFTSDATGATGVEIQSGAGTWLPASTPFGAVFGSSQGQPYASVRYAASQTPSTTTFTFSSPTPTSGWGFTLGDIDADAVTVSATDAAGDPVPIAGLGFEGTFNYAGNADLPTWDAGTGTLTGSGSDTTGAAGWFRPTAPLRTLTFVFSVQTGFPIYQVWFAAQEQAVTTTTAAPTSTTSTTSTTTTPAPTAPAAGRTAAAPGGVAPLRFAG
jgi:hypothetical protein